MKVKCRACPKGRRKLRDVENSGECFWHYHWSNGNYDIPAWPGLKNWFKVSFFNKKLEKCDLYKKVDKK
ncbi:hypothetical protein KY339_01030 [Candidatus Woesearchaeota archaeon]|nr:hypothetical protein [Candidatus Woesearchaeota archaeon]